MRKQLFLLLFSFCFVNVYAGNGSANTNGNWGNPSSWLINGAARVPTCGDTVVIPVGVTITVNNQQIYTCQTPLVIIVRGALQFTTGNKLDLPCGSLVQVDAGGVVRPGNGGGNSNYISICNTVYWNAAAGNLNGPAALGGAPLPITLLAFEAEVKDRTVLLKWATATEVNNEFFTVERSATGGDWEVIGRINGAGNSSTTLYYSLTDEEPLSELSYYRLKQTDFDGNYAVSAPVAVYIGGGKKNIFVAAGLNSSFATIVYSAASDAVAELRITDLHGRIIQTANLELSKGSNQLQLDVMGLPAGIYLFTIVNGSDVASLRAMRN